LADEESKNELLFSKSFIWFFCLFNLFNELNQNPSLKKRGTFVSKKFLITIINFIKDSSSPSASQNDNPASFCHSEESSQKANDEESKNRSFILFEILHSASLHSERLIMLSCHSESAINISNYFKKYHLIKIIFFVIIFSSDIKE